MDILKIEGQPFPYSSTLYAGEGVSANNVSGANFDLMARMARADHGLRTRNFSERGQIERVLDKAESETGLAWRIYSEGPDAASGVIPQKFATRSMYAVVIPSRRGGAWVYLGVCGDRRYIERRLACGGAEVLEGARLAEARRELAAGIRAWRVAREALGVMGGRGYGERALLNGRKITRRSQQTLSGGSSVAQFRGVSSRS